MKFRLFWKLVLALWASMLLSMFAALAYLRATTGLPPAPPGMASLGPLPLVPVITGMLAMLAVGIAVAWSLAGPLRHLREGSRRVAGGDFGTRVAPLLGPRRDELAELAQEFDRMVAQLQELTQSRQQLLHDLSHELRSPLARMQAAIGLQRQDPRQTAALVERIERECGRLDALIGELLTLHRLEAAAEGTWSVETIDLMDVLQGVVEDADFEARAEGREVVLEGQGSFVARVHGELIYRALENVIRNAVKYTAEGTAVQVQARIDTAADALVVTVLDRGPGVPEAMRERMFQPFVRLEGTEAVRGVGLGLAIARRAVHLHGGDIRASARPGGGLQMLVQIPRAGAAGSTTRASSAAA